jgi:hypothetical protein
MAQVLQRLTRRDDLNHTLVEPWLWDILKPCFGKAIDRPKISTVRDHIKEAMFRQYTEASI